MCFGCYSDDDKCTAAFGTCKWTDEDPCNNGDYARGKCAGPNNRRCCIRKGTNLNMQPSSHHVFLLKIIDMYLISMVSLLCSHYACKLLLLICSQYWKHLSRY